MDVTKCVLVALILLGPPASDRPTEIPLWPAGAPGSEGKSTPELVTTSASGELSASGIHNPSITPYLPPKDKATGLAILVIPGGGHRVLAITHEGYNSEGLAEAYLRFKRAGVPAELHIYSAGGHGFGLRSNNKRPVGQWIVRFEEWLAESGFLHRS